ncbi:MAG: prepilin peptidase [Chloroflexota bacterium]|nr:MAG: prepilin peptidase [Chloroflexota bacterium]
MAFSAMLSAYLAMAAAWDFKRGLVPNWLTVSGMAAAGGWQLYQGHWQFLEAWAVIFALWMLRFFGGGDDKLMMVLFALYPSVDFLVFFSWVALAATLPQIVLKHRRTSIVSLGRRLKLRLATGIFPGEEELDRNGVRSTWIISLAGVLYVWLHPR